MAAPPVIGTVSRTLSPYLKVTMPVAAPWFTVAVSVTVCPTSIGFAKEINVVVIAVLIGLVAVKVAVTALAMSSSSVQAPVPLQSPLQPPNPVTPPLISLVERVSTTKGDGAPDRQLEGARARRRG